MCALIPCAQMEKVASEARKLAWSLQLAAWDWGQVHHLKALTLCLQSKARVPGELFQSCGVRSSQDWDVAFWKQGALPGTHQ